MAKSGSELSFARHRSAWSRGSGTEAIGAVNIAYLDAHVELRTERDLVDPDTGKSTLNSLWSPLDFDNP
jgi:prepilin-type processing-associated H-X9-DG protein